MAKLQEKSQQSIEDRALVEVLQDDKSTARDKEKAFNKLYARHERSLRFFFLKKLQDEETSDDLKMVTFEKAHENIASYDEKFAFSTWLYKIATNTLIDHLRKANFEVLSIEALSGSVDDEGSNFEFQLESYVLDPEEILARDERIEKVKSAIDSLDNQLIKELMEHRFINDYSFERIAKEMGIENNSTLRVNILRGKEILKEKLRDINPFT